MTEKLAESVKHFKSDEPSLIKHQSNGIEGKKVKVISVKGRMK